MAISYLSQKYESNPYTIPFSLDLMGKVNSYKQSMFYKNADNLKNQLSMLKNTDIINQEQKNRLDNAYNSVITQINEAGSIDYSDMNIVNQIEGLGSQIYDDPYVLNGIQSTRKIRQYQSNLDKIKTDPKLNKFYDAAREAYDTDMFIAPYVTGGLEANYNGPNAPTPSLGNDFDILTKEIQKLKPNITVRRDSFGNQYFYDTETSTEVDRNRILSFVDGKIDGAVADQLKVHAWYNYEKLSGGTYKKEDGIKEITQPIRENLRLQELELENLNSQTPVIASDIARKNEAIQIINSNINTLKSQLNNVPLEFGKLYDQSPTSAYFQLYTGKIKNDIADTFAYKQTKSVLTANLQTKFENQLDIEAFRKGYNRGYDTSGNPVLIPLRDSTGNIVDFNRKDSKESGGTKDDKTTKGSKKQSYFDDKGNLIVDEDYKELSINKEENPQGNDTPEKFLDSIENLKGLRNSVVYNEIEHLAKKAGVFEELYREAPSNNRATTPSSSSSDMLSLIQSYGKNKKEIEANDINDFLKNLQKTKDGYTIKDGDGKAYGLTQKGYNFFDVLRKSFDNMAEGNIPKEELINAGLNPDEIRTIIDRHNEIEQEVEAKELWYKNVLNINLKNKGYTDKDIEDYYEWQSVGSPEGRDDELTGTGNRIVGTNSLELKDPRWSKYYDRTDYNSGYNNRFEATDLKRKISKIHSVSKKDVNEYFKNQTDRFNQYSITLPNFVGKDDNSEISQLLFNGIRNKNGDKVNNVDLKGVRPTKLTKSDNGDNYLLEYTYSTTGDNKKTEQEGKPIELSREVATKLGGTYLPSPWLEEAMRYQQESKPYYISNGTESFKYTISRLGSDRNNVRFGINFFNKGVKEYFEPKQTDYSSTANAAKYFADQLVAINSQGLSREQFFELLRKYKTSN